MNNFRSRWRQRFEHWQARRVPPRRDVTLNRRIIYILPTPNGLMYSLAAGLIFIGAINYAVSLAFGLAFMMVSIFILAILYSFNNLNHLKLTGQPALPVYCGEEAAFNVLLSRSTDRQHEALELNFSGGTVSHANLVGLDREQLQVFVRTTQRGEFKAPLLRITTYFPLGLCRAWSVVDLDMHCLVYPKPVPFAMDQFSFNRGGGSDEDAARIMEGSEDFYGLRDYVVGDPLRQVAWKNVARGQGMQIKQFVDYADDKMWLDWDMFYGFAPEERLSRLCYGVLHLSRSGKTFGLKLPGLEVQPGNGSKHRNKLLKALALYGAEKA